MKSFALSHFDDFLAIACQQPTKERLLFVFTRKELPEEHTEEQARQFEAGSGGHLSPLACVDKAAEELDGFDALVAEAREMLEDWDVIFAAALACSGDQAISKSLIDEATQTMLQNIREGFTGAYLVFDRAGRPLQLSTAALQ